ncbi:MAG: anthranilate synthase component I [Fidelibacterota bacterium]|nr:MAG: anthranilate synthase component I [Candidatus Neomarinimicrobiota bacterium]
MNFDQFEALAQKHSAVPVYRKVLADLLTPVSAFMRLARHYKPTVLLESVEGGRQFARYSYICVDPHTVVTHADGKTIVEQGSKRRTEKAPFLSILREQLASYDLPQVDGIPDFCGGWVGYLGYETTTWVEQVPIHPHTSQDIPDAVFMLFQTVMAFDHLKQEIIICHTQQVDRDQPLRSQYEAALAAVDQVGEALHTDIDYQTPAVMALSRLESNLSQPEFMAAVKQAKEHIFAGDVFQLVLSQRFYRETQADSLSLYRALRNINPSPYMFYFSLDDFAIIGASPELFVKVEGQQMEVRPIAGTRPRGKNHEEDARLAEDLLADEKELAEHLMLVDLGRNDVGRVSRFKSVSVKEFMVVERYSHVMHIVSDVRGELLADKDALDALLAGFPAGTVTGAPKIRAMELIHELEPSRRGIYAGTVGYLDFHGNLNTCIAIRTMLIKDGVVSFQSGAGIVADSDPAREYDETVHKAEAIMRAVDFAERGLE